MKTGEDVRPPVLSAVPEVVVYGTVCLDRFVRVDADGTPLSHLQAGPIGYPERVWQGTRILELPGGEAFNTATALVGWGVRVLLTGTAIGQGLEGDRLRELLDRHPLALGLPRTHIPDNRDAVTPVCTIRVFPDGERSMSGRGFAQAIAPQPLPDVLLVSRPVFAACPNLGEAALNACRRAAGFGCPLVTMDMAHLPEMVALSRIAVTSRDAFRRFFGEDAAAKLTPSGLAVEMVTQGARTAIITLGGDGCLVADRDEGVFTVPAYAVPNVVDTTGAGDVFRAGLCYGLLRELSLLETVRFASAAAALHCQQWGGGSRPNLSETLQLAGILQ